ncbi:MAG: copper resistance protein CopD [Bacillota bacterium]|nr:copper resistance protein CopD [Bacillota bacterium]MDI3317873.1 copper resistance protein CopD [Bacillota bacterium]
MSVPWARWVLFLHLAAAIFWIGEMLTLSLILVPASRKLGGAAERARLFQAVGRLSRPWMLGALAVLIATGLGNLAFRGVGGTELLAPSFYASGFGRLLGLKLGLVTVILLLTLLHDRVSLRSAGGLPAAPGDAGAAWPSRLSAWLGRLNLLASLAAAYVGLRLLTG